jgi:hypothetical protein
MTTDNPSTVERSTDSFDTTAPDQETHPLAETGREVAETTGHLAERATNLGIKQADRGREQAADGIEQVADSIRRVSLDMEGEQPTIADAAQTAAEQAERIARYLRETDARELITNVEDMARRQPLVFLGGAFVAGFVAARFIKAAGGIGGQSGQRSFGSGNGAHNRSGVTSLGGSSMDYRSTGPGRSQAQTTSRTGEEI